MQSNMLDATTINSLALIPHTARTNAGVYSPTVNSLALILLILRTALKRNY